VEPQYPNGIDFASLSAAAQQHDRDGSGNASSGTCNRDEEKNSARGEDIPGAAQQTRGLDRWENTKPTD
jgi:hypothetical protein